MTFFTGFKTAALITLIPVAFAYASLAVSDDAPTSVLDEPPQVSVEKIEIRQ